jgi:hypothetical protein
MTMEIIENQPNGTFNIECCKAECRYAECRGAVLAAFINIRLRRNVLKGAFKLNCSE